MAFSVAAIVRETPNTGIESKATVSRIDGAEKGLHVQQSISEKLATPNTNNTDSIAYTYPATSFVEILISGLATM